MNFLEQEGEFLVQRAFGHPSRTRLVNYADVVAYLKALRCLEPGCSPASAIDNWWALRLLF